MSLLLFPTENGPPNHAVAVADTRLPRRIGAQSDGDARHDMSLQRPARSRS